jgi:hypothetical protein
MKSVFFTLFFFILSFNFFSQDTITDIKQLDSIIKKIEKDILELKLNQKNSISESDCSDLKKKDKDSFDIWKKTVPELRIKIGVLSNQILGLNQKNQKNKLSIDSLNNIVTLKIKEISVLNSEKNQLVQNKNSTEKYLSDMLLLLRKSTQLDTNFFNSYKNLEFASNYNLFISEIKKFSNYQNELSKIELKLNNREFKDFPDLSKELNLITIDNKFEGLAKRKELILKDIKNLKSLFKDLTLKINEINAKSLPQWKFNGEFIIPLETFKLSEEELFIKYPFIQYQIDQVMKNQKHVLPVIN